MRQTSKSFLVNLMTSVRSGLQLQLGGALVELILVNLVADLGNVPGERRLLAAHRRGTAAAVLGRNALACKPTVNARELLASGQGSTTPSYVGLACDGLRATSA